MCIKYDIQNDWRLMKSSKEDLKSRGFIERIDRKKYDMLSSRELREWVRAKEPNKRTLAVQLLSERHLIADYEFAQELLNQLKVEKSLYTKIEICKAFEKGDIEVAKKMTSYLGLIGKNQYRSLPDKVSKKRSYPLPRDIIARSLGKMDISILPVLLDVLKGKEENKISEVIDAIGFLLFYRQDYAMGQAFEVLTETMTSYYAHDIIFWKSIVCLSAFRSEESIERLKSLISGERSEHVKNEARRSLDIILGVYKRH